MEKLTRILVVDDEKIFHTTLKELFDWEKYGFILVGFASTGQEALNIIDIVEPDLVITDIIMPEVNGIELTRQLKLLYPDISVLVLSSFDDFTYVKHAMKYGASDYILKTDISPNVIISAVSTVIENEQSSTGADLIFNKNDFLLNLINNYYTNLDFISKTIIKLNIDLNIENDFYLVKAVWADWLKPQDVSYKTLVNYLSQTSLSNYAINIFHDDKNLYLIGNARNKTKIKQALYDIHKQYPLLIFSISDKLNSIDDFNKAIGELEKAKLSYFYNSEQHIFSFKDYSAFELPEPILTSDIEKYINSLDFSSLSNFILSSLNNHKIDKNTDPNYLKKNIEHIIYYIINFLENLQYDVEKIDLQKLSFFKRLSQAPTIEILKKETKSILQEIENEVNASNPSRDELLMSEIEDYISNHYSGKVFLSDIAEHVHLNYHYMSKKFNSLYGMGFNDFLNNYRINKAKTILLSTNVSISSISISVGFMDQSHFSKIFRETVGMSPRKFRKTKKS